MTTTTSARDHLGRLVLDPRGTATDYVGRSVKASNKDFLGRGLAGVAATGATAGTPGTFTPSNAVSALNLAQMANITANPLTAWTTGQRMLLRDGTTCHWTSTAWAAGNA